MKIKILRYWDIGILGYWAYSGSVFLFALMFLFACQGKKAEPPSIPEDKMVRIMADLNVAEAATMNQPGLRKDSLMRVYFFQVFEMHGITQEEYEKNLRIYASDMEQIERMTQQVEDVFGVDKKGEGKGKGVE